MEIQALNSSIIKGIYYAYEDSAKFNGFINPIIKPEYLITVNVAKSIREDFDLIIKLEVDNPEHVDPLIPENF